MIKIYGPPRSSAGRCYLILEEAGVPYENMPLDLATKEHKSEKYLKLNPNGKVPCLVDGDYVIWESVAINQYIAEKYKPELTGKTPQEKGRIAQWSTWAMLELQPPLVDILIQVMFTPEDKKDPNVVKRAHEKIPPALKILDAHMTGKTYIMGDKLSLADFNVASVVNIAIGLKIPMDDYEAINEWMIRMRERPSFRKYLDMRAGK